jgi:hypothetical protein
MFGPAPARDSLVDCHLATARSFPRQLLLGFPVGPVLVTVYINGIRSYSRMTCSTRMTESSIKGSSSKHAL